MSAGWTTNAGFAALSDLEDGEWNRVFNALEAEQSAFLARDGEYRSAKYPWPRDALHTWSRLWEYPFAFHQIHRYQEAQKGRGLRVLDFGSGVTFFPFVVAHQGHDVLCADIDRDSVASVQKAAGLLTVGAGRVSAALVDEGRIPVPSGSQDLVYCISVVEHIREFEDALDEMARVLRPGGRLVLTVDIDLRGNAELGAKTFYRLQQAIDRRFARIVPERSIHPCDLLTSANSPLHMRSSSPWFFAKQFAKALLRRDWPAGDWRVGALLAVHGTVVQKPG